ncbi:hypothetical protein U9M48_004497 [Paspalum notatum var. saurae]|uniref:Uncharacterized protein n=1 Tax=Paspalum notatum var. saurae TaxID=547442 RepID=A0AAQ3PK17_PASNO
MGRCHRPPSRPPMNSEHSHFKIGSHDDWQETRRPSAADRHPQPRLSKLSTPPATCLFRAKLPLPVPTSLGQGVAARHVH